jgi:hypothetical protein
LEKVWKKGGMAWLRGYPGIFLQKLRETTETSVRIIGALAEIRTGHLQNISFKYYNYSQVAQFHAF